MQDGNISKVKDVCQLKDREKIAPKEKSITTVLLKEVLLCLVDGSMVILQVKLFRHGNILSWRLQSLRETKSLQAHRKDWEAKIGQQELEERALQAKELFFTSNGKG